MASEVDVANMALSLLGSESAVVSLSPPDGSAEAGHCKRFYPLARREALEIAGFSWAKARAKLAAVSNPSKVWTYAYALPGDCINPLRVLQTSTLNPAFAERYTASIMTAAKMSLASEAIGADYEIEGNILLTHEPDAMLLYIRDVIDLTQARSEFVSGLSYLLASFLAGPIIKGREGAAAGRELRAAATSILMSAAVQDTAPGSTSQEPLPASVRMRY